MTKIKMSNLLCTKTLILTGTLWSQKHTKLNGSGCGQSLLVDGNITVLGDTIFCGTVKVDIIDEKTPLNGIDTLGLIRTPNVPILDFNDPDCNTHWGFDSLLLLTGGNTSNTAFGYNTGRNDTDPNNNCFFGKNCYPSVGTTGAIDNAYFGARVVDSTASFQHNDTVIIGSEASLFHGYHGQDFVAGYRSAAGDGILSPCTFDLTSIGAHATEFGEINFDIIAIGVQAKEFSLCDFSSTAVGYRAQRLLSSTFSGAWSSCFGSNACENFEGTGFDIWTDSFGALTLVDLEGGEFDTAFGGKAGARLFNGDNNVVIGYEALGMQKVSPDIDMSEQTIVGVQAMYKHDGSITEGHTIIGQRVMFESTTSEANSIFGFEAAHENTSGSRNTIAGHSAMYNNADGDDNVVMGYRSMFTSITGSRNVIIGDRALETSAGTNDCVLIGKDVGNSADPGDDCILVGSNANIDIASDTGAVGIGANSTVGSDLVTIGESASCTGTDSIVLGQAASDAGFARSVCLGTGATATATDQVVFPTGFILAGTATSDGAGAAVPAQVAGYITLKIGGSLHKVPLYPMP
jgi:hypothetical protein